MNGSGVISVMIVYIAFIFILLLLLFWAIKRTKNKSNIKVVIVSIGIILLYVFFFFISHDKLISFVYTNFFFDDYSCEVEDFNDFESIIKEMNNNYRIESVRIYYKQGNQYDDEHIVINVSTDYEWFENERSLLLRDLCNEVDTYLNAVHFDGERDIEVYVSGLPQGPSDYSAIKDYNLDIHEEEWIVNNIDFYSWEDVKIFNFASELKQCHMYDSIGLDENIVSSWNEFNQIEIRVDNYNMNLNYDEIIKSIYPNMEVIID